MTTFFNQKEEVIDLQLTPFGEALLSIGHLQPVYYAFFDDDVLYDASGSAGFTEAQNNAEPRIQENTPTIKSQAVFSGIESNLAPLIGSSRFGEPWESAFFRFAYSRRDETGYDFSPHEIQAGTYNALPPNIDQNFTFTEPLGTMDLGSKNAPAWNVRVLQGQLTGAINYMTSSAETSIYNNVKRIPQLEFDVTYQVLVGHASVTDPDGPIRSQLMSKVYPDGTFLYLSEPDPALIFAIDEENSPSGLDYDMEIFLMEGEIENTTPTLTPMNFLKQRTEVVNGILLDQAQEPSNRLIDASFAEYFFLVNADREIPSEDICPVLEGIEARGITLAELPYDCPDVRTLGRFDIYDTNAVAQEPCDD